MARKYFICFVFVMLLLPSGVFASDINSILNKLGRIDSLEADFKQATEIKGFGKDYYKGKVYLERGKRVLWDYNNPYEQYYLFTDTMMEYYDSSTEQLIRQKASASGGNNIVFRLLVDITSIKDSFDIEKKGENLFRLDPLSDVGLKFLEITFGDKYIDKIYSLDNKGNYTTITFSNVKINTTIPESVFNPEVPLNTEVFTY